LSHEPEHHPSKDHFFIKDEFQEVADQFYFLIQLIGCEWKSFEPLVEVIATRA
jgi:hypothetical protein